MSDLFDRLEEFVGKSDGSQTYLITREEVIDLLNMHTLCRLAHSGPSFAEIKATIPTHQVDLKKLEADIACATGNSANADA